MNWVLQRVGDGQCSGHVVQQLHCLDLGLFERP